jgi:hypothetical protein
MIFHGIYMCIEWSLTGYTTALDLNKADCSVLGISSATILMATRTGLVLFEAIYIII